MKRRRVLSSDERALWRRATRDVAPLNDKPLADEAGEDAVIDQVAGREEKGLSDGARRPPLRAPASTLKKESASQRSGPHHSPAPSVFHAGDPRAERHVRRGRRAIEATFDLHGHTQVSARAALLAFLSDARVRGRRSVLVITGKGAPQRMFGERRDGERGVLKSRVTQWLDEPDFRRHIVRASQADARHGGAGALYIFLRR